MRLRNASSFGSAVCAKRRCTNWTNMAGDSHQVSHPPRPKSTAAQSRARKQWRRRLHAVCSSPSLSARDVKHECDVIVVAADAPSLMQSWVFLLSPHHVYFPLYRAGSGNNPSLPGLNTVPSTTQPWTNFAIYHTLSHHTTLSCSTPATLPSPHRPTAMDNFDPY